MGSPGYIVPARGKDAEKMRYGGCCVRMDSKNKRVGNERLEKGSKKRTTAAKVGKAMATEVAERCSSGERNGRKAAALRRAVRKRELVEPWCIYRGQESRNANARPGEERQGELGGCKMKLLRRLMGTTGGKHVCGNAGAAKGNEELQIMTAEREQRKKCIQRRCNGIEKSLDSI